MVRFLLIWLCALTGLVACVVGLNVFVDPYGILNTPSVAGLTEQKVAAADWPRLAKPYRIEAVHPASLVLGSSNVDVGINPSSDAWPAKDRPVFNLAIDGASPDVQLDFLKHAFVRSSPKLVLIGLSFEDSFEFPSTGRALSATVASQFSYQSRLRVMPDGQPNPSYDHAHLLDLVFATLSFQALSDSISTLLNQNDPGATYQTNLGQNNGGKFGRWARNEGFYSLVMDKDRDKAPQFIRWAKSRQTQVKPVGEAVHFAQAHGARVVVFIMPGYVDKLELFRQAGLTGRFLEWKAEVAATVAQAALGGEPVSLWDFSGYSQYTTEPLPGPGDTKTVMQWTWEPIHFRPALGELLVRRMLGTGGPDDLGQLVTANTLQAQQAEFLQQQEKWVASHPADVARLAEVMASAAQAVCPSSPSQCLPVRPMPLASQ